MINLDGIRMNVIETAGNGVVNHETFFRFRQKDGVVSAKYEGGGVIRGFLAGRISQDSLTFSYAQQHTDGNIARGASKCEVAMQPDGKLTLIEHFDWEQGKGKNVFREV